MCGIRRREMKMVLVLLWAAGAIVLGIGVFELFLTGSLGEILKKEETKTMLAQVLAVFLWNLLWLSRGKSRKIQILGIGLGSLLFAWCHQMLIPAAVSGVWIAVLIGLGKWLNGWLMGSRKRKEDPAGNNWEKNYRAETLALGLVTGSAMWMVIVCGISLTGHGGVPFWRLLALILTVGTLAVCAVLLIRRRNEREDPHGRKAVPAGDAFWQVMLPDTFPQALLGAFILTMILLQAGRLNIELDYDSLHYGLRSGFVLDNGKGIYENLGMNNLVYSYSKGLEVLNLPLSGTPTYGFVLAFSFWTTVGTVLLAGHIGGRNGGKTMALWTAAVCAAIPGIMNMAVSAKSDSITLLYQLIIYDFLCLAIGKKEQGKQAVPWLLFAVAAYIVTLVFKPTALVFSTALGAAGLLCLLLGKNLKIGNKRGVFLWMLPLMAAAGLWYRTWRITGVPITSIFAGMCEKIGFEVKYPFNFSRVIGDPWALSAGEKAERLMERLKGILLAPVGEDMDHVIIAWGTGLVTILLILWCINLIFRLRSGKQSGLFMNSHDRFDGVLTGILLVGSVLSIYTLSQVDGNYFMLVYAVLGISAVRMTGTWIKARKEAGNRWAHKSLCFLAVPFFLFNTLVSCTTSWAGTPGFTPVKWTGPGCYNHRTEQNERKIRRGYEALAASFSPRDRVLAFGYHPEVLDLNCCVQSYYDVTGSGGDVYLVKKLAYFEEFLEYAGVDYFFVQAGYLADRARAFEIVEDMIEEGTLRDLTFEWGNMKARVALDEKTEELQIEEAERFRQNYCMRENGFR